MADDGRTLDFRVSVAPGHAGAISRRQAGFTDSPRGGWVSVWEHLVMQVASVIADGRPGADGGISVADGSPVPASPVTRTGSTSCRGC